MLPTNVIVELLINACWQAACIALIGAFSLYLLRTSPARTRHLAAVGATLLCVIVPFVVTPILGSLSRPSSWPVNAAVMPSRVAPVSIAVEKSSSALTGIAVAYLCLVAGRLAALVRSRRWMTRLRGDAVPIASGEWYEAFQRCRRVWQRDDVGLVASSRISVPIVCGWLRPVVVVPARSAARPGEHAPAILAHELAHVSRRDVALNLVIEVATAPLVFHPAVAWMKRLTAWHRELATDELAIAVTHLPRHRYALALLHVASWYGASRLHRLAPSFGGRFEQRVRAILDSGRRAEGERTKVRARQVVSVVCLMGVAGVAPLLAVTVVSTDRSGLAGEWRMDPAATRPQGGTRFVAVEMTIGVSGLQLSMDQTRTRSDGRTERLTLQGTTDRAPFDIRVSGGGMLQGAAYWQGDRLIVDARASGLPTTEHVEAFLSGGTLIFIRQSRAASMQGQPVELRFRRPGTD